MLDAEGKLIPEEKPNDLIPLPQVVDPTTAMLVRRILCDVPIRGTASAGRDPKTKVRSDVWNIFGKTGTAHISVGGHYSESKLNSSFIGAAPAENPRLVIVMAIHEPDKALGHYGGVVSAPAAGRVLERALAYLQVPASPDLPLPPPPSAEQSARTMEGDSGTTEGDGKADPSGHTRRDPAPSLNTFLKFCARKSRTPISKSWLAQRSRMCSRSACVA